MKKYVLLSLIFLITCYTQAEKRIIEATKKGDYETVKQIISEDPSQANTIDIGNFSVLHWACMRAQWDIAKVLIENGADLNFICGDGGTPINWAAHHDNPEFIKYMIENGAKQDIQNQWGMTELHTAVWRGCIKVVEFLLDHGSDPYLKTKEGWTVMHYAYRSGHDNIISMLKERGLSFEIKDNAGRTPEFLYFKKPEAINLGKDVLKEYVGRYYYKDYLLLEIWMEGDKLKIMEFGPDEIYPVAKDFFYFVQAPWTLIFSRDENGNVQKAQLSFIRRSYALEKK